MSSDQAYITSAGTILGASVAYVLGGTARATVAFATAGAALGFSAAQIAQGPGPDAIDSLTLKVNDCFGEVQKWSEETFGVGYLPTANQSLEFGATLFLGFWFAYGVAEAELIDAAILGSVGTVFYIGLRTSVWGDEPTPYSPSPTKSSSTSTSFWKSLFISPAANAELQPLREEEIQRYREVVDSVRENGNIQSFGIKNVTRNDCGFSSALQTLFHCPPLRRAIFNRPQNGLLADQAEDCFRVRFVNTLHVNGAVATSDWLRGALGFSVGRQEDAVEILNKVGELYKWAESDLVWKFQYRRQFDLEHATAREDNDFSEAFKTGEFTAELICKDSEPTWIMELHKPRSVGISTLQEVLDAWTNRTDHASDGNLKLPDREGAFTAPITKEQLEVLQDRDIFFCQFKARSDPQSTQKGFPIKAEHSVVKINGQDFRLDGFIQHSGSAYGGHYTTYMREGEYWVYYNDDYQPKKMPEADALKAFSGKVSTSSYATFAWFSKVPPVSLHDVDSD